MKLSVKDLQRKYVRMGQDMYGSGVYANKRTGAQARISPMRVMPKTRIVELYHTGLHSSQTAIARAAAKSVRVKASKGKKSYVRSKARRK